MVAFGVLDVCAVNGWMGMWHEGEDVDRQPAGGAAEPACDVVPDGGDARRTSQAVPRGCPLARRVCTVGTL